MNDDLDVTAEMLERFEQSEKCELGNYGYRDKKTTKKAKLRRLEEEFFGLIGGWNQ